MADETTTGEKQNDSSQELTAKQRRNKKKKEAAKRKKQEQRQDDTKPENTVQEEVNKSPQELLEDELAWCIEQMELGLLCQKTDKKTALHTQHMVNNLKSSKTPMPKKRQIMFSVFGDYRKKMADDLKTYSGKERKSVKAYAVPKAEQKSVVIKVIKNKDQPGPVSDVKFSSEVSSTSWNFNASGTDSFKFNFNLPE
ncbi:UPF0488 protein C8orf33 homolog [Nematostella vectensis]|uniref:UPF0488 protein C8orf33 homolog n=1 Tax=Nematostella vectensis TaxID=45351 RepID=UPI0020776B48|nr:UPF0488 protein C8orf33 homolog [Nematostella vectensis]